MADKTTKTLDAEERSLLRVIGTSRAENELERMKKKLILMKQPISSPKNPSFHNLHRSAAEVLNETARLRHKAVKSMAEKKHKYYIQRRRETGQELHDDMHRIINFPEQVGSRKTKDRLLQMRKTINDHRIQLDMEEHRLNECKLSDEIKIQRSIELADAEKRREARKKEKKWLKRNAKINIEKR